MKSVVGTTIYVHPAMVIYTQSRASSRPCRILNQLLSIM